MTAAALFFAAVGFVLGLAAATRRRRDDSDAVLDATWQASKWEAACRAERAQHDFTRAALRNALAALEAADQAVILATGPEWGAALEDERGPVQPVKLGGDVCERFCWN